MSDSVIIEDDGAEPAPVPAEAVKAEAQPAAATTTEAPADAPPKEEKVKRGTNYLDFDALPKEIAEVIEPRFKRLYGNLKAVEREREQQFEINRQLAAQLDEISQKVTQRETDTTLDRLRSAHQQAMMSADYAKATEIMEQITDYKSGQKTPQKVEIPQPSRESVDLSPQEQRAIVSWQAQTDENGQPLRPWAQPSHPKFSSVMKLIGSITDDPDFAGAGIGQILAEADRKMGGSVVQARSATVLSSQPEAATRAPRAVALSDTEKRIAVKMFRDTGMAKTDDDAYNRYRAAKSNSSRSLMVED